MLKEMYISDSSEALVLYKELDGFEINMKKCALRTKLIQQFIGRCTVVHALVYLQYRKKLPEIKNDKMA